MDTEGLDPQKLHGAPPLMPWQKFAEWIGMGDEPFPASCCDPQSLAFLALRPSSDSIFPLFLAVFSTLFRHFFDTVARQL